MVNAAGSAAEAGSYINVIQFGHTQSCLSLGENLGRYWSCLGLKARSLGLGLQSLVYISGTMKMSVETD